LEKQTEEKVNISTLPDNNPLRSATAPSSDECNSGKRVSRWWWP